VVWRNDENPAGGGAEPPAHFMRGNHQRLTSHSVSF
jgi:hypothetical protein